MSEPTPSARPSFDGSSTGESSPERLGAHLEASLLRELMRTWRDIANTYFKGGLHPPVMRLVDGTTRLGAWDRRARCIELSRPFVMKQSWGSVVEVLKHEVAHQYAHEVLGAIDETAHGPAFRKVCALMGIDPAASGTPEVSDEGDERVLKKVADLLALAQSGNRHEAENAAALAQRLMLKHNVALADAPGRRRYGFRHLGAIKGRHQESEHILAGILADHFFVEAIWVPGYRPEDGMRGSVLEICGSLANLEMASYVHDFLQHTAERLWKEHKRAEGIRNNRDRRSYIAGVMEGFRERLASEKKRSADRGLVWVGDADLHRYHRRRHPHVRTVRLQGHGPNDARRHGRAAGRNIVLHRGVKGGGTARGKALPPGR